MGTALRELKVALMYDVHYIYIFCMHVFICKFVGVLVGVCVCMREREIKRDTQREREM